MLKRKEFKTDPLDWLMETDNLAVQYLARRDLTSSNLKWLMSLQEAAHKQGPVAAVLDDMQPEGYWVKPGAGYQPKYRGTVWSLILLSQLGASIELDERLARACSYLLNHSLNENGQFSYNGAPSGTIDCLQGNLCAALLELGCSDPGLDRAFEWMARSVTGEGVAPVEEKTAALRYYAYKCGPRFACGANGKLPCAWGAVKVMLAFSKLPLPRRTPLIERAIKTGVDFLFSRDPADADYPCAGGKKPSGDWWRFGFPVFYITDLLQNAEALTGLGYGSDPRLVRSLQLIRDKMDAQGRWNLEFDYGDKTWVNFGVKRQPNKWVTLRALRVLNKAPGLEISR